MFVSMSPTARTVLIAALWSGLLALDLYAAVGGTTGFLAISFVIYVLTGGSYTLYLCWHTLPRDIR